MEYLFQMFKGLGILIIIAAACLYIYYRVKKEADND